MVARPLLILLAITVLNVYKPAGVTPYGWRKQRSAAQRSAPQRSTRPALTSVSPTPVARADVRRADVRHSLKLGVTAAGAGFFVVHFAEMLVAIMLGMMIFVPFRLFLTAQGYTALLDANSVDFQAWMGAFMVVPMAAWMRLRGCGWRDGAEMSAAMVLPAAAVLGLRGLGLEHALPWLSNSEHTAMLVGMLAFMLYGRERYSAGYSLPRWPVAAAARSSARAELAELGQPAAPARTGR